MRLVGNDVVDLDEPVTATAHLRDRFVARVCHESERALLARAVEPRALLWSFFAAKEAAYKVVSKLAGAAPVFAHREFVVASDLRSVQYRDTRLGLRVIVAGSCVHAVAWLGDDEPISAVQMASGEPSSAARRLLLGQLGGDGLEVVRQPRAGSWDGFAPPRVLKDGAPLGVDVSLSHDGRYVACALVSASPRLRA